MVGRRRTRGSSRSQRRGGKDERPVLPRKTGVLDVTKVDLTTDTVTVNVDGMNRDYRLKRHPSPYGVVSRTERKTSATPPKPKDLELNYGTHGKTYVARITGRHPRYVFNRDFLSIADKRRSSSRKTGSNTYELPLTEGTIYEVSETGDRKYYIIKKGKMTKITNADARQLVE